MSDLKDIMEEVERVRNIMNETLNEKGDLLDKEVIVASQILDSVLNEYYKILNKKIDKK
ncbi:Spo0E like sporulation regulatory protein [Clostridium homopropionicum DSM 5847]|uniref:Spo0E like sporulation regulatory protein n=1 Tax=Clostridium homopropionicum DSM 5847 TaxID=1121318 RepID=A0A0L6Z5E7_9CLOT|nr:aspartyl-phosphate phosphatase Spo0E family protein [Clostridium homopropionicum]KOA18184.1 Spo0E like sporulation regulatory protein [Clostridium homopropionicum DSM 5847]SFF71712.1 Spo0E like sporulation regulatory protein [Clostridium homopropionicum]